MERHNRKVEEKGASVTLTGKEVLTFHEQQVGHMFSVHDPVLTVSDAGSWADSTFRVITLDDALRTLTPLVRPLPPFAEE